MKLKCIGGPNDNEYWDVPDYFKLGDLFQVHQFPKKVSLDFKPDELPTSVSYKIEHYQVIAIHFNKEQVKYLIHMSLSPLQAFEYQLKKAIPEQYISIIKLLINDFGSSYLKEPRKQIIELGKYLGMTEDQLPIEGM